MQNKVNRYGLKMSGLRRACSESRKIDGTGLFLQVAYDREQDRILIAEHADRNSRTVWRYTSIIGVAFTGRAMTMQEIADSVESAERFYRNNERGK